MKSYVFYGDDLVGVDFPSDLEIIKALPAVEPLRDVRSTILEALLSPIGFPAIDTLIKPGMKLVIAFDDACLPIPPMASDIRKLIIDIVVDMAKKKGIKEGNIRFICANGLHRKWTKHEIAHLIGKRAYGKNVVSHDAEDPDGMVYIGKTHDGYDVDVNKAVIESDLVIYVNVNWVSMNGGWKSVIVGLGSLKSINQHHNASVIEKSGTLMQPETSLMHEIINSMGMLVKTKAQVFQIETVLNNDIWGAYEKAVFPLMSAVRFFPQTLKGALRRLTRSYYKPIAINAGSPEMVHKLTLRELYRQQNVKVESQADVVIVGVPNLCPYSAFSEINPVLFFNLLLGYIFNFYHNKPVLKKGGVLIALNPVLERFNSRHHPSYIEFYNRILPMRKTQSPEDLEKRFAMEFAQNPAYISKYRFEYAYHGIHPFYAYGMGMRYMNYIGKVIVVGARNKDVVEILGFEQAPDIKSALAKAESFIGKTGRRVLLDIPPLFVSVLS